MSRARWFTSHINENTREIATVARLFGLSHYLETYDRHGLIGRRSVLAHNVHPTDQELKVIAARDASVSHCPSSNSALGSGLFPLTRHLAYGVRVALGSDVGAGTGFSLFKEGAPGLLHAAAARRAGLPARAGPPAAPGDHGRRRGAGDGRPRSET